MSQNAPMTEGELLDRAQAIAGASIARKVSHAPAMLNRRPTLTASPSDALAGQDRKALREAMLGELRRQASQGTCRLSNRRILAADGTPASPGTIHALEKACAQACERAWKAPIYPKTRQSLGNIDDYLAWIDRRWAEYAQRTSLAKAAQAAETRAHPLALADPGQWEDSLLTPEERRQAYIDAARTAATEGGWTTGQADGEEAIGRDPAKEMRDGELAISIDWIVLRATVSGFDKVRAEHDRRRERQARKETAKGRKRMTR